MNIITVGIGEFKVERGSFIIKSISLGSCVGVVIYDSMAKIAGLAHIMLADSSTAPQNSTLTMTKYADIAISQMLEIIQKMGGSRVRLVAKIAGGACMFQSAMNDFSMNIGARNVEAVKKILECEKISVMSEEIGKNYGRTIKFNTDSSILTIKSAKFGEVNI